MHVYLASAPGGDASQVALVAGVQKAALRLRLVLLTRRLNALGGAKGTLLCNLCGRRRRGWRSPGRERARGRREKGESQVPHAVALLMCFVWFP